MGSPKFSENFKRDAVHQIVVRGYRVSESFGTIGCGQAFSLYVGEAISIRWCQAARAWSIFRDRSLEAGIGSGNRGKGHPKKVTAYFAKDAN